MKYFDYSKKFIDDDGKEYSGICFYIPNLSDMKDSFISFTITVEYEFRPDKIAYLLYNDDKLSWVLDEINNINHIKEYEHGKTIFYLPYNILVSAGIV